jgi:deazaflavin-dependent oxidoreductase (nitroreductase family)
MSTTTQTAKTVNHSAFSRWMQHRMNGRLNRKIRAGRDQFMGMDVLILHTVGRKSGQPRQTPLAWFPDSENGAAGTWLIVGSGGKTNHPDWHLNLIGRPDEASVELPGSPATPITPEVLEGAERDEAWKLIAAAQPRLAKYQAKSDRLYPIVRLTPR